MLLTSEQLFINLIRKFDCAFKRIRKAGHKHTLSTARWGLTISPSGIWQSAHLPGNDLLPFSLLLHNVPINRNIYGNNQRHFRVYTSGSCPYLQLELMYLFKRGVLSTALYEGTTGRDDYDNAYVNTDGHSSDMAVAFDVGRYLLDRYIGMRLPYRGLELFKKAEER